MAKHNSTISSNAAINRKMFFHCGAGKTGSSALQAYFYANKEVLKNAGISYENNEEITRPDQITSGNGTLLYSVIRKGTVSTEALDSVIESYFSDTQEAICSSEGLCWLTLNDWQKIRDSCNRLIIEPRLVSFIRDVEPYYISAYHQVVKRSGECRSFEDFFADSPNIYNHLQHIRDLVNVFGQNSISVLHYETVKSYLDQAFFSAIGRSCELFDRTLLNQNVNRSLSTHELKLLKKINHATKGAFSTEISDLLVYAQPSLTDITESFPELLPIMLQRHNSDISWTNQTFFASKNILKITSEGPSKKSATPISKDQLLDIERDIFSWMLGKIAELQSRNTERISEDMSAIVRAVFDKQEDLLMENFDSDFYLKTYSDIAKANVDPIKHYQEFGIKEGRLPCKDLAQLLTSVMERREITLRVKLKQSLEQSENYLNMLVAREASFAQQLLESGRHQQEQSDNHYSQLSLLKQKFDTQLLRLADSETVYTRDLQRTQQLHATQVQELIEKHAEKEEKYLLRLELHKGRHEAHRLKLAAREKTFYRQLNTIQQASDQCKHEYTAQLTESNEAFSLQLQTAQQLHVEQTNELSHAYLLRENTYLTQISQTQRLLEAQQVRLTDIESQFSNELKLTQQTYEQQINLQHQQIIEREYIVKEQLVKAQLELSNQLAQLVIKEDAHAITVYKLHSELNEIRSSLTWRWSAVLRNLRPSLKRLKTLSSQITAHSHTPQIVHAEERPAGVPTNIIEASQYSQNLTADTNSNIFNMTSNNTTTKIFSLDQLLSNQDDQFITLAYLALLGRAPDIAGRQYYENRLRNGISKLEIIMQLAQSVEGKSKKFRVEGISNAIILFKLRKVPVLRLFLRSRNKNKFEMETKLSLQLIDDKLNILSSKIQNGIFDLHTSLDTKFKSLEATEVHTKLKRQNSNTVVSVYFDSKWYLEQNPDLQVTELSAYDHYISIGQYQGRHPAFDSDWYLNEYPDVRAANLDAYLHYITNGKFEGRHPRFDRNWYLKEYSDVVSAGIDPYDHYITNGKAENRYPAFDRHWYLNEYKDVAIAGIDPYEHYKSYGKSEGKFPAYHKNDTQIYFSRTKDFPASHDAEYQNNEDFTELHTDIKAIAFYLPQFHTCEQNDRWWGKDFTEWTNTRRAKPHFPGHYQPREPHADIGYYDLANTDAMRKQAVLARQHGIYGFCFYHYWFSGSRILEKPVDLLVQNLDIDIKFCLCWANENWTKTWDGMSDNLLMEQKYLPNDAINFIRDISVYVKDSRYICIDGKPVIMVYKPHVIPEVKKVFQIWRKWWRENIGGDILIWCNRTNYDDTGVKNLGDSVDAVVEFPPHVVPYEIDQKKMNFDTTGHFFDYQHLVEDITKGNERTDTPEIKFYRSVMLGWDNSARRKKGWSVWYGFSLDTYYAWLCHVINYTRKSFDENERFIFINAWNEWAEGTYLEPDQKSGYSSINTTSKAIFGLPLHTNPLVIEPITSINTTSPGKIAIHIHIYFDELANEMLDYINRMPYAFDLFITTDKISKVEKIKKLFKLHGKQNLLNVLKVPNVGRDIGPLLVSVGKRLAGYDYVGHFHTKKSNTVDWGDNWRHYLLNNLLGGKEEIAGIFKKFSDNKDLGLVYPPTYPLIAPYADWGSMQLECSDLLKKIGCEVQLPTNPNFPAGNMFWAKGLAIRPLLTHNWTYDDFEVESGQVGKTLSHAVERIWKYMAAFNGYNTSEILCKQSHSLKILRKRRLVLFTHYEPDSVVSDADLFYLHGLNSIAEDIVVISNNSLSPQECKKLSTYAMKVIQRENSGFDFGAWRDAINEIGWDELAEYDEVILANNSCYGPVFPFENMFSEMDKQPLDFWSTTGFPFIKKSIRAEANLLPGNDIPQHLQSYFLVFKNNVLRSNHFKDFWLTVENKNNILEVIALYETQLTCKLESAGFRSGCYLRESIVIQDRNKHIPEFNTVYTRPEDMMLIRSPLIKKKVSIYSPQSIPILQDLVKKFGYYPEDLLFSREK